MTIINGPALLRLAPIEDMIAEKRREHGVSYGLTEAGYDVRIKQAVTLTPMERFTLASTVERFKMPFNLVGVVHDKSTWARRGLSVFNTVLEPGWEGWLTLELVNHSNGDLHIPSGAGIAQVLFHELHTIAAYSGKYQGQEDRPVEARHE